MIIEMSMTIHQVGGHPVGEVGLAGHQERKRGGLGIQGPEAGDRLHRASDEEPGDTGPA